MSHAATAAVLRPDAATFDLTAVELDEPRPDEVLVRLVSSGICRTDVEFSHFWPRPAVLGHEGAGVVEAVGGDVTTVGPGDHVIMSFRTCGECPTCASGEPAYCRSFDDLNFTGRRSDGSTAVHDADGSELNAHFLGQSSFATHVIASERSVVRVGTDVDLNVLGALGCGFQTGAGTVVRVLKAQAGQSVVVFGAGAVGLAAVMAAAAVGCAPIVAVDPVESRRELALELGATHVIDALADNLADQLLSSQPGGYDGTIDTTGRAGVVSTAVNVLNTRGTCAVIGVGADEQISVDWRTLLNGRTITGVIGGNSLPQDFIPELIQLHRAGAFPIERLVTTFPFEQIDEAFAATANGSVIKAVVTF